MLQGGSLFEITALPPSARNSRNWIVPYTELLLAVAFWGLGDPLAFVNACVALSMGKQALLSAFGGGCLAITIATSIVEIVYILSGARLQELSARFTSLLVVSCCNVLVGTLYFITWLEDLRAVKTIAFEQTRGTGRVFAEYKLSEVQTFALSDEEGSEGER